MNDIKLIAALRKCKHCENTGQAKPHRGFAHATAPSFTCPHCRLARMAADRIEHYRSMAETNNEASKMLKQLVAEIVRERCAKECNRLITVHLIAGSCADVIRALTVEELLK